MGQIEEKRQKYVKLAHAVQSGVAVRNDKSDQEPKHLRTGINVAMCDHAALVQLMLDKGIITQAEYLDALNDSLQKEVDKYRASIAAEHGVPVEKIHLA